VASNGAEAVDAVRATAYDVILMDCQMPVMDGFTATREIREHEAQAGRRAHIIALTANALAGDRERCLQAGMDAYLRKPFQAKQLFDALEEALESRREEDSLDPFPVAASPAAGPSRQAIADDQALYDPEPLRALHELVGDADPTLIVDMVRAFIDEFPPVVAAMRDALDKGDPEPARALAHTWESRSGNLGARRVQALCHFIQVSVREGRAPRAPQAASELAQACEDTIPMLLAHHPGAAS
jgi:CheY-like chemotaxis protein/HPt (histidine-containing phosphotransfer) domain-containing protein